MIPQNITALSPGVGDIQDVLGGWRAPVYAWSTMSTVPHSIGQTFPYTDSASVWPQRSRGEEELTGHPNGSQSFSRSPLTALVSPVSPDRGG